MERKCSACKIVKPIDMFYISKSRSGGHEYVCKECAAINARKYAKQRNDYALSHKKEIAEYNKKWRAENRELLLKKKKEYYESNKISIWERAKEYMKTKLGKTARKKGYEEYKKNSPDKVKANFALNSAVRSGKLPKIKTLSCSVCKIKQAQEYHHHKGYEEIYWLDVIPVCSACHKKLT